MLTDEELERYARQILLPDFDIAGQERLRRARVLVLGLGGLGSPVALYLAAAGVGELVLADGDAVSLSNLQRQVIHIHADCGGNKARSAARAIARLNPLVSCTTIAHQLDEAALQQQVAAVDLVVDGSDNYPTRFALNRACIAHRVPLVSAAAVRAEGQLAVFDPARGGPCYRCLYPEAGASSALSCSESGVLGPAVGVMGSLQALEALKRLSGFGEPLRDTLLMVDFATLQIERLALARRAGCPDCEGLTGA